MAQIPIAKLGALLVKTLAKPVASRLKERAKSHPRFNNVCIWAGRTVNNVTTQINLRFLGHKPKQVKELQESVAVARGADFMGEVFIFTVGGGIVLWEYQRQAAKNAAAAAKKAERQRIKEMIRQVQYEQLEEEMGALNERLGRLEDVVTRALTKA